MEVIILEDHKDNFKNMDVNLFHAKFNLESKCIRLFVSVVI
jgi:hypothetical protein